MTLGLAVLCALVAPGSARAGATDTDQVSYIQGTDGQPYVFDGTRYQAATDAQQAEIALARQSGRLKTDQPLSSAAQQALIDGEQAQTLPKGLAARLTWNDQPADAVKTDYLYDGQLAMPAEGSTPTGYVRKVSETPLPAGVLSQPTNVVELLDFNNPTDPRHPYLQPVANATDIYKYEGKTYKAEKDQTTGVWLLVQVANEPPYRDIDDPATFQIVAAATDPDRETYLTDQAALAQQVEAIDGDSGANPLFQVNGEWYQLISTSDLAGVDTDDRAIYTVDNPGQSAVAVHMADYWTGDRAGDRENVEDGGINAGHTLKFDKGQWNGDRTGLNTWTGAGNGPRQGIVQPQLDDAGYPVLAQDGSSLQYLFAPVEGQTQGIKFYGSTDDASDDHDLFDYQDGTYSFDSATGTKRLNDEYRFETDRRNQGQFFPFDQVQSVNGGNDHWFGLSMNFDYLMPEGGRIQNRDGSKTPMIFTFSGDDDFWLFIDGQLALDLGGIHDAAEGSIDFTTGTVTAGNKAAMDAGHRRQVTTTQLSAALMKPGTHNIKIFYMERGNSQSNLAVHFNMRTPEHFYARKVSGQLTSSKLYEYWEHYLHLPTAVTYSRQDLPKYQLHVDKVDADSGQALRGATFTLTDQADRQQVTQTADAAGQLTFKDLKNNGTYTLTETHAPTGYQRLTGQVTVTIRAGTIAVQARDGDMTPTNTVAHVSDDATTLSLTVRDRALGVLPATGGTGPLQALLISSLAGLIAVGLFGWAGVQRRKEDA
ncbi:SpaA isopeptide-forming pilin-related protein [Lacticaseibacillus absianus]|uniref:SpaA isopeptide-forming pilin-related protein n=1 Tax=Lacticaseibacillus absianus TaxID=2729623 RepID=UPI0015CDF8F6